MSRARRRRLTVTLGTALSLLAGGALWALAPASPGYASRPPELPAWAAGATTLRLVADATATHGNGPRGRGPARDADRAADPGS
ncbi:hypothetical protein ACFVBJ_31480, partial [Streptomyces sp. NPDC057676]